MYTKGLKTEISLRRRHQQTKKFNLALLKKPLDQIDFVVFDIETTGGNPERNGITEIFAIHVVKGKIGATFHSLVDPGIRIPPIVRKITGITNKMLKGAPKIDHVMPLFLEFIADRVLVSHNILGDLKFIEYYAKKTCRHVVENLFLCTHLLSVKLIPDAKNYSLSGLAETLALKTETFHRAREDAYCTLFLFQILCKRIQEKQSQSLEEVIRFQGSLASFLKIGWQVEDKVIRQAPACLGVISFYDNHGKKIFVTSAYNMKRAVHQLKAFNKLPKALAKVVLQSAHISYERFDHIFSAMRYELQEYLHHSISYKPSSWHGRLILAYLFSPTENSGFELSLGHVKKGVSHAYGPVSDRQQALKVLQTLADYALTDLVRGKLFVSKAFSAFMLSFFDKRKFGLYSSFFRQELSLRKLMFSKERQDFFSQLAVLSTLSKKRPKREVSLFSKHSGMLCLATNDAFTVYPVLNLICLDPIVVTTDLETWFSSKEAKAIIRKLKQEKQGASLSIDSKEHALHANLMLWFYCIKLNRDDNSDRFLPIETL